MNRTWTTREDLPAIRRVVHTCPVYTTSGAYEARVSVCGSSVLWRATAPDDISPAYDEIGGTVPCLAGESEGDRLAKAQMLALGGAVKLVELNGDEECTEEEWDRDRADFGAEFDREVLAGLQGYR